MKQNDTYDFPFVEWSYIKLYANFGRVQISNQSLFKGNGIWEFCGRKWKGLSRYEWQDVIELSHNVKILITHDLTILFFRNQVKQTIILGPWLASDLCHGCSDRRSRKDERLLKLFLRQRKACFQSSVDNSQHLDVFLVWSQFSSFHFSGVQEWQKGGRNSKNAMF